MFACGCGLLIFRCIALHPLVLGLQICCLFPYTLMYGLGCLDIRLNIQFFLFNMRFSRYMCASHSHAWRVEMERFELLTPACKAGALPTELHPHGCGSSLFKAIPIFYLMDICPVGLSGLEPPTSRLSGVRSNRLSYKPGCNPAATCSPMPSPA